MQDCLRFSDSCDKGYDIFRADFAVGVAYINCEREFQNHASQWTFMVKKSFYGKPRAQEMT